MLVVSDEADQKRATFFKLIWGHTEGYISISSKSFATKEWKNKFFEWPTEVDKVITYIASIAEDHDVWYSTSLYSDKRRLKENAIACPVAWADLDECQPPSLLVPASVEVESSPGRWQALWRLAQSYEPGDVALLNQRIAYFHRDEGADVGCWDLARVLRVPFTYNFKYPTPVTVELRTVRTDPYELSDFAAYPELKTSTGGSSDLPTSNGTAGKELLDRYGGQIPSVAKAIFQTEPTGDWSVELWKLEKLLLSSGVPVEDVFLIAKDAACNKYRRDNRSDKALWAEVLKAERDYHEQEQVAKKVNLLTEHQRKVAGLETTFIDDYVQWAKSVTDAPEQFHEVNAFILLSSVVCGAITIPISYGQEYVNLWTVLMADSTNARKSTTMNMSTDILLEVDDAILLATDGSLEGLLSMLALRPGRPSLFHKDEFAGLLESMVKKDYLAGMMEGLTKLYDGRTDKRVLRRETIMVKDPRIILLAGGIKTKILSILTDAHITSGFFARFIPVTAEVDPQQIRPAGPPTPEARAMRAEIVKLLTKMRLYYNTMQTITINGKAMQVKKEWLAELTPEAWDQYNVYSAALANLGDSHFRKDLASPAYNRLAVSGLKCATLLAACRMEEQITVNETDIIRAFQYVESRWLPAWQEIIDNVGISATERMLQHIVDMVKAKPGLNKSYLMRTYKLDARNADVTFSTLAQRGLIRIDKQGNTWKFYPTGL